METFPSIQNPSVNQEYRAPISAENQQGYIKRDQLNSEDPNGATNRSFTNRRNHSRHSSSLSSSPSKHRQRSRSHTKKHNRSRERYTQDSSATTTTTATSTRNAPRYTTFPKPPNFNEAQGDWRCQDCGNWNFAKRTHCNSCKIENPRKTSRNYNERDDRNYNSNNRSSNREQQYDRYSGRTGDYDRRQQYDRSNGGSSRSYGDRDRRNNSRERSRSNDRYNNSRNNRDDRSSNRGQGYQQEGSLRSNGDYKQQQQREYQNTSHEGVRQYNNGSSRFSSQLTPSGLSSQSQPSDGYRGKQQDQSYNINASINQNQDAPVVGYDQDRRGEKEQDSKGLRDPNHRQQQRNDRDSGRDDYNRYNRDDNRSSRDVKGGRDNSSPYHRRDSQRYRDDEDGGYNSSNRDNNSSRYSSDMPARKQFQKKDGDWECVHCKNINYARRNECNRCRKPKE